MFRAQNNHSDGLFIRKSARVIVIAQICFVLWYLLWAVLQPAAIDFWDRETQLDLYEYVLGKVEFPADMHVEERMELYALQTRNLERMHKLPADTREDLQEEHAKLKFSSGLPLTDRIEQMLQVLIYGIPPFTRAWLFFAFAISVMLLLHIEGAVQASWLLPVITAAYAYTNFHYGFETKPAGDAGLFPTEQIIIDQYLKEPLSGSITKQHEQLMKGWHIYLITVWAGETPSSDKDTFKRQVEEGEYRFTIGRIEARKHSSPSSAFYVLNEKESSILLFLYLLWNTFFALFISRPGALYEQEVPTTG